MYRKTDSENNINEEALLAEYGYKTLHKLIKSGMWKMYCSRDFQIRRVEWSDDLRKMVGYTSVKDFPDLLESWSDLLHPDDYDRVMDGIDPVLRDITGNTIFDEEYRLNTKDRGYRSVPVRGTILLTKTVNRLLSNGVTRSVPSWGIKMKKIFQTRRRSFLQEFIRMIFRNCRMRMKGHYTIQVEKLSMIQNFGRVPKVENIDGFVRPDV